MPVVEAAFFDLDKTVIDRASLVAFGPTLRRGGLVNRRTLVRAVVSQLLFLYFGAGERRLARVREALLRLSRGWDRAKVRELVREALLETVEPIIYTEALAAMEEHRRAGHRVYLVSASPEEIVLPLAELLGTDGAVCSQGEVDADGRFTGSLAFYAEGSNKADAIRDLARRTGIALSRSTAYSDSISDLPMLEAVGHPVAVNPDRALAKVARARGWEVARFTRPTRLHRRVARRAPAVAVVVAVTATAVLMRRHGERAAARTGPRRRPAAGCSAAR